MKLALQFHITTVRATGLEPSGALDPGDRITRVVISSDDGRRSEVTQWQRDETMPDTMCRALRGLMDDLQGGAEQRPPRPPATAPDWTSRLVARGGPRAVLEELERIEAELAEMRAAEKHAWETAAK